MDRFPPELTTNWLMFEPDPSTRELRLIETLLAAPVAEAVAATLLQWSQHHSDFLLTTLPSLLNPSRSDAELNPTGLSIHTMFPRFSQQLARTTRFAIFISPDKPQWDSEPSVLFIGLLPTVGPADTALAPHCWAYFMPETLDSILARAARESVYLSPQLRQMYLRANGAPLYYFPYFTPSQSLYAGTLAEVYRDMWYEVDSAERFERLENFVTLVPELVGDDIGIFKNTELLPPDEPRIYRWDHESVCFVEEARDFAGWLQQMSP